MGIISFLASWQFVLIFYVALVLLIYKNREKFEFQGKVVAMYRTQIGIKAMQKLADRFRKPIIWLAYVGIVVGYLGMLVILYFILLGMWNLIFVPNAPATLAPVIPGVKIPGSPIFVPFWYGMLSIFIVIVIHEFSHGVVSKAHKIPVKNSGFVMFGPIPGAFVEPDEKELKKRKPAVQNSLFAAGPFSNIITALIILGVFAFAVNPFISNAFQPSGFNLVDVTDGLPASIAGLDTTTLYTHVGDIPVSGTAEFIQALEELKPGETVLIGSEGSMNEVVATEHPDDTEKGYIGVHCCTTQFTNQGFWLQFTLIILELLNWVFILSLGLGLANLLPLGPVDGGRMYQLVCHKFFGKKKGDVIWAKTAFIMLALIVILIFTPILKASWQMLLAI
ncbi:site-2 protease family protein [Nanoarchaeota archaeon]